MLKKELLCTLGPASFNKRTICRLEELGVNLFRINLSHTGIDQMQEYIHFIRRHTRIPVCLDTEGAQIRLGGMPSKRRFLDENETLVIGCDDDKGIYDLSLYPHFVTGCLRKKDLLDIDFDSAVIQVTSVCNGTVKARVLSSGWVGPNKAVNLLRPIHLPAFTEKDKKAVETGMKLGIRHFALSFTSCGEDVRTLRGLTGGMSRIIAKVESQKGYENLDDILLQADAILLDRGDLSREVSIELIPFYQKRIIERANQAKKAVYIATNLLESMVEKRTPTRAEVNDIMNALMTGADGLVLAAETAIGKRPVECASMVVKLMKQFYRSQENMPAVDPALQRSVLVEPHGGQLVCRWDKEADWDRVYSLKTLRVCDAVIMDVEQIGTGTYSPLQGFMTRDEIHSVLDRYCLPGGTVWTLPIVLQARWDDVSGFKEGEEIALVNERDNQVYAVLKIKDIYRFPFEEICRKWFGSLDTEHQGVRRLKLSGDCFLGGEVTLLKRRDTFSRIYEFTPDELRHIFDSRGWSRVVGFHTRNVMHRGHEEIQRLALESTNCDGMLLSPVIGEKKKGDFSSEILLQAYQLILDKAVFPKSKAFIGAFSTYSRYSGPREAVFTAICRKNFGCSHFIVGRDHTGTGNFYSSGASQELFESLGDIGIVPVFFDAVSFCLSCEKYVFGCSHHSARRCSLSGTQVRDYFVAGRRPPDWLMRGEISEMILDRIERGEEVFV